MSHLEVVGEPETVHVRVLDSEENILYRDNGALRDRFDANW